MSKLIQTEEDRKELEKNFGVYHDNVNLAIKKDGYDMGLAVGIFKKEESFVAYAGQDFEKALSAEGKNYSEAIEKLLEIL